MGVTVRVGIIVEVLSGTGVGVSVGRRMVVGVGVTVGETVGEAVKIGLVTTRVGIIVGVEVGMNMTCRTPVSVGVGVLVEGVVHQGAVKEKPSNIQVRLPPPLQVVWKTSSRRPGWNNVTCPRSSGAGENRFPGPTVMETAKLLGL